MCPFLKIPLEQIGIFPFARARRNAMTATTIDVDVDDDDERKRPSFWVVEELMRLAEEELNKKDDDEIDDDDDATQKKTSSSSTTFFRLVKKFFFAKTATRPPSAEEEKKKRGEDKRTREMVAMEAERKEDEEANNGVPIVDMPSLMRGDYSLLWLKDALDAPRAGRPLDRDIVGAHAKNVCESFVFTSKGKNDPRNSGETTLRQSAREVLEMCCVHVDTNENMKEEEFWQQFGKRLQRLMPREEFCEKDAHLNNIKAELLKVKTRRDFEEILKKSRENTGRKFENALKKFVQLTMKKVNEEFAGGRATTMDQLAKHHQDGWLSMRNTHVNWNRSKGMPAIDWPEHTNRIAKGNWDVVARAKSDDIVEEQEDEEPRQQQERQPETKQKQKLQKMSREVRRLEDFNAASENYLMNQRKRSSRGDLRETNNWSALGRKEEEEEQSEDISMPVLPPNKGRSKSTSRGKSKSSGAPNIKPPMEELVNTTLQAKDQENQRGGLNVISQTSVEGPTKTRGEVRLFNSPRPAEAKNDGFDMLNKALEERDAREKMEEEKAADIVASEEEEEELQQQLEVDDGFAQLNAVLNKREEEKKRSNASSPPRRRSGWSFLGFKQKEPDEDDDEEEEPEEEEEQEPQKQPKIDDGFAQLNAVLNKRQEEKKRRSFGWSFLGKRNEPEEEEEEEEPQKQPKIDDGFAQLNAALNKRQEEKKKRSFGWSFLGKRNEPEEDDDCEEEEEEDSDIIPTQQIGGDDDTDDDDNEKEDV